MSRVTRAGSHRNRVVLPDYLEDRTVPSGNVSAFVLNGVLQINGDGASNHVWVTTGRGERRRRRDPVARHHRQRRAGPGAPVRGHRRPPTFGSATGTTSSRATNSLGSAPSQSRWGTGTTSVTVRPRHPRGETHLRLGDGDDTVSFGMGEVPQRWWSMPGPGMTGCSPPGASSPTCTCPAGAA